MTHDPDARGAPARTALLWLYAAFAAVPLLLILLNSFRSRADIYAAPLGWPTGAGNYVTAWERGNFSTYFLNSVLVTAGALALGVGAATLAGYALGRLRFRGREAISALFLAGLLLPAQLGVLPIFALLDRIGLVDTRLSLVLVYAAQTLPFSVFLLAMFFRALPVELEEAARLDGAGEGRIFLSVMLPLVRPALATVLVVQVAPVWNDFFFPLILLRSEEMFTLPVGLTAFVGRYSSDTGALAAGLVIVSLPLILLFLMATRHVVAGLTAGIGK